MSKRVLGRPVQCADPFTVLEPMMHRFLRLGVVAPMLVVACSTAPSTSEEPLTASIVGTADLGTAAVTTELPTPLRIEVRQDGVPLAGVPVTWSTVSGVVAPGTSVTDSKGLAATIWTVGTAAGAQEASAKVAGDLERFVFHANVVAGPPASVAKWGGDQQINSQPARLGFHDLLVGVTDAFGNSASAAQVVWSVMSGPVALAGAPRLDEPGKSVMAVVTNGQAGEARVRAELAGTDRWVVFSLEVSGAEWRVGLQSAPGIGPSGFLSLQNRTAPAVDTLPVGATMEWRHWGRADDAVGALVVPVGSPGFGECVGLFYDNSTCRITFATAGTYRYALAGNPAATGTIIVR